MLSNFTKLSTFVLLFSLLNLGLTSSLQSLLTATDGRHHVIGELRGDRSGTRWGDDFRGDSNLSLRYIKIRSGQIIDYIEQARGYIDNSHLEYYFHGGNGGSNTDEFMVDAGDYITQVRLGLAEWSNYDRLAYIKIYTANGVTKELRAIKNPSQYKDIGSASYCISGIHSRESSVIDGARIYAYANFDPQVSYLKGSWKIIQSYNPTHSTTVTETMKVGVSSTNSGSSGHSWGASVSAAYNGLTVSGSVSGNYEGYINSNSLTIEETQREITRVIEIEAGQSTVLW